MDRQAIQDMDGFQAAEAAVSNGDHGVELDFITPEVLAEWREWVTWFMSRDFDWQRLKRALNRMYRDNNEVQDMVDLFLANMPDSLEAVYEKVPRSHVEAFRKAAVEQTLLQAKEYLGEA